VRLNDCILTLGHPAKKRVLWTIDPPFRVRVCNRFIRINLVKQALNNHFAFKAQILKAGRNLDAVNDDRSRLKGRLKYKASSK
jgi:hypothetical protein